MFKSFKTSWGKHVQDFISQTGIAVGHSQFFRIMKKAWNDAVTAENVSAGFVATGICPFNPGVIPDHAYLPADLYVATPLQDQFNVSLCDKPSASTSVTNSIDVLPVEGINDTHVDTGDVLFSIDIQGSDQVVDLPVSLDENGMLKLLEEQLDPQPGTDSCSELLVSESAVSSNTENQSSSLSECDAALALSVVESAITDEKKQLYQHAYDSGNSLDDSMYVTWKLYKSQLSPKPVSLSVNPGPSNPMLVLPKQEYKKPTKKNKYFVVTSDECFKSKLEEKVKKEKKNADLEERKRQRQLKREMKEKSAEKKVKKEKKS